MFIQLKSLFMHCLPSPNVSGRALLANLLMLASFRFAFCHQILSANARLVLFLDHHIFCTSLLRWMWENLGLGYNIKLFTVSFPGPSYWDDNFVVQNSYASKMRFMCSGQPLTMVLKYLNYCIYEFGMISGFTASKSSQFYSHWFSLT